jgi:hypothetical protein
MVFWRCYCAGSLSPHAELRPSTETQTPGVFFAERAWNANRAQTLADENSNPRDHRIMLSPSAPTNRKIILIAAAMLAAGTSITFAQGGGADTGVGGGGSGGARGGAAVPSAPPPTRSASPPIVNPSSPNTVPQSSSAPLTPSTPSSASSGEVTPPANEKPQNTTARSERRASLAKRRWVHHHRGRSTLVTYSCGYLGCARTYPWAFPCQYYSRYCYPHGYTRRLLNSGVTAVEIAPLLEMVAEEAEPGLEAERANLQRPFCSTSCLGERIKSDDVLIDVS